MAQRNLVSRYTLHQILDRNSFEHAFYDVNLRKGFYDADTIAQSLEYTSIFKLSDEEVDELANLLFEAEMKPEDFVDELLEQYGNLEMIVLTEGAKGCRVFTMDDTFHAKSDPVDVKDTVGAGDSFSASFLYTFQKTKDIQKAAEIANRIGGFVASSSGAVPSYSDEIRRMLP